MDWIINNLATIVISLLLIALVVHQARKIIAKGGTCDCGGCAAAGSCHGNKQKKLQKR